MAKKPTPKYKTPRSKTKARYASFARRKINQLEDLVNGSKHKFKKAETLLKDSKKQKELDKITKVKA